MDRVKKLKLNTFSSLLNRLIRILAGVFLPRLILVYYGSETNGLVTSITQFLSIITFLDLGIGSVVQSALYQPLARKDKKAISGVLVTAQKYFRGIAYVLVLYVIGLIIFYPLIVNPSYSYLSTAILILALSISTFGQYYLGIVNELLLNADQRAYIQYTSELVVVFLNFSLSVFFITQGYSIQLVKLISGLVYLIRPVYLNYYVNKNYNINYQEKIDENPLPQKWNAVGQHIAFTIQNNIDVVILTFFSTLENISVYSIYNLVVQTIRMLITSMTTGIGSFFGDLLANNEVNLLNKYFDKIEWITHTSVIFLYGLTAVLINSFVLIYTSGVSDVNYYAPVFSLLLVLATIASSIRIPYRNIVFAAGHFKQTQLGSYVEATINISISALLVMKLGLVGIAIGTLISMLFGTLYLVFYLSKNIVHRPLSSFVKHLFVDIISFLGIFNIGQLLSDTYTVITLTDWLVLAILQGFVSAILLFIINLIFYREIMIYSMKKRAKE